MKSTKTENFIVLEKFLLYGISKVSLRQILIGYHSASFGKWVTMYEIENVGDELLSLLTLE